MLQKNMLPPSEVRRFRCSGLYRLTAMKVTNHIHESRGGDRMPSQPIGMKYRNYENQETKWSIPGPQYFSEKVYTGQISLSTDNRVNESHCHICLNQLAISGVVVGHCIPHNNASILAKKSRQWN
jgi:hypothetical protein